LLQLAHSLVPDLQQLLAREGVLVLLDALQDEFLVLLLEGAGRAAGRRWGGGGGGGRAAGGEGGQHGSTCTVTSASCRSRLRRSSTASAMACASWTFAFRSTAIVTSA